MRQVTFFFGLVLLETLPVSVCLQTAATIQVGDPNRSAAPLWFLLLVVLVGAGVGRVSAQMPRFAAGLLAAPLYVLSLVVAVRISPATYGAVRGGPFDFTWVQHFESDVINGSAPVGAIFGLAALLGYLWWRGIRRGRISPDVDMLRTIFVLSFGVLIGGVAVASVVPSENQPALAGRLEILLLLEAFAGLMTLSIARMSTRGRTSRATAWTNLSARGPWIWLGVIVSGATVLLALIVSLTASYNVLIAGLRDLGPVGRLIATGLQWLVFGILYLVDLVLGGAIQWLIDLVSNAKLITLPKLPAPPPAAGCPDPKNPACNHTVTPAQAAVTAIIIGVVLTLVIVVLVVVVSLLIRAMLRRVRTGQEGEERESLDVSSLLRGQLRSFLAGLRRAPAAAEEALPAGSVRALYRDVLREAAAAGLPRGASETPDEYLARAGSAASGGEVGSEQTGDLAALTEAYDQARYGDEEPPQEALRALRARVRRLLARLRGLPRARGA